MKPDKLLAELEEIIEKLNYRIRWERGRFKGDSCVLEGDRIVMLNKNHPTELNVSMLSRFLIRQDLDSLHIKPAVRKELEVIWAKNKLISSDEQQNLDV
ncbi:MAG: hypothetical protein WD267_04565 [Balneolales bacterium]